MREFFSGAARSHVRLIAPSLIALALVSCGGGGGGGSGSTSCPGGFLTCSGTGTDNGSTTQTPKVTLTLVDAGTGTATNNLTSGKPLTVRAVLVSPTGLPLANRVVTFTTDSSLAVFDPTSGTRLTDANGLATINLLAADLASSGAAQVTATVDVDGASVTQKIAYAVSPGAVTLSNLTANSNSLSAYGSTSVSVQVFFNGVLTTTPLTVNFSSGCDSNGKASITKSVATINGVATATYTDKGCAGSDIITASLQGTSAQTTIAVAAPRASNIGYVSASPSSMALAGTGGAGLSSSSVVTFKVVDSTNNPVASKAVSFDLSTRVGGIKLNNQASGPVQATSDGSGLVSVTVSAGSVPTPVWVTATLVDDPTIVTQSTNLTISTGRPTQDRFSLSIGTFNIEGWSRDGTTTRANVYAFDRLGNPVADGTVINFISEGAGIQPSCVTAAGSCSVTVTSGELRPRVDSEPSNFAVKAGRVTILAYAQGEESFDDLNQNNIYDAGEVFRDLGDAFVDNTEDRVWASGEREIQFSALNTSACPAYPSDGRYANAPYKAGTCDGVWGNAHVRRNIVLVLSSHVIGTVTPSTFTITPKANPTAVPPVAPVCSASFTFRMSDINNNPLPAGAALTATSSVTYKNDTGDTVKATVSFPPGSDTVSNTNAPGGTFHTVLIEGSKCATDMAGKIGITVTSPSGDASSAELTIN
ncbi:MAG: hypothetical protein PHI64_14505 [Zoogloea sp.]|uniref:hypothetical protein n=1 Tax=Zoogloea sp. TaxID=49181 RepID=UPI0026082120|nr:hypothetical protein [Zoogloea sp.]MDD2990164.1 hypothetical protein [Zoogloea sp.]